MKKLNRIPVGHAVTGVNKVVILGYHRPYPAPGEQLDRSVHYLDVSSPYIIWKAIAPALLISEPAWGSVRAKLPKISPLAILGT